MEKYRRVGQVTDDNVRVLFIRYFKRNTLQGSRKDLTDMPINTSSSISCK
jgi:hypothetical protein